MIDKRPIIIFELLPLQVFCYQTIEEWSKGLAPEQVFWKRKGQAPMFGPFHNIYSAVHNYTAVTAKEANNEKIELPDNIIMIDFKKKTRLN